MQLVYIKLSLRIVAVAMYILRLSFIQTNLDWPPNELHPTAVDWIIYLNLMSTACSNYSRQRWKKEKASIRSSTPWCNAGKHCHSLIKRRTNRSITVVCINLCHFTSREPERATIGRSACARRQVDRRCRLTPRCITNEELRRPGPPSYWPSISSRHVIMLAIHKYLIYANKRHGWMNLFAFNAST